MILVAKGRNDSFVQGVLFKVPPYSKSFIRLYFFFNEVTLFSYSVMLSSKNNILFD